MVMLGIRQFNLKAILETLPLPKDMEIVDVKIENGTFQVIGHSKEFEKKEETPIMRF